MGISVLFTSFDDRESLLSALEPVLADPATDEVVVVVDGSRDGTFEALQARASDEARLRPFFIENRGRSGARQYGLERISSDVVLLLDADVIASPLMVSGHEQWHRDGTRRVVLGYMPVEIGRARESFYAATYARMYEERSDLFEREPNQIFKAFWGGNFSLPRQALVEAGGLDAGLGLRYHEDLELGFRLSRLELEPVFDRSLCAEHHFCQSLKGYFSSGWAWGHDMLLIQTEHGRPIPGGQPRADGWLRPILDAVCLPLSARVLMTGCHGLASATTGSQALQRRIAHLGWLLQSRIGRREAQETLRRLGHNRPGTAVVEPSRG